MSLNCNEINVILSELDLAGSFIQDIVQPGYDSVAFCTYKNSCARTVLVCTAQNACRINSVVRKIPRNDKPLRFMEFLRSRVRGARIDSCSQIGLERVVRMELSHAGEKFTMYIRLWNNAANIILCDADGIILDSLYRRPAKNEMTGRVFVPPVPRDSDGEPADRWPVRTFDEIQVSAEEELPFNRRVDLWYSEYSSSLSREALLVRAEKWYSSARTRMEAALRNLERKLDSFRDAEKYRHQGDLILSYGHLIDGNSNFIECCDYDTGKTVSIAVDPSLSAHENAALCYRNYKKAVSGAGQLEHDIENARRQIARLEQMYAAILREPNPVRIEQMLRRDSAPKQQQKKNRPGLDYNVDGWCILVGRDAEENDGLLRHHVRGEDLWLHVRDYPGGYVFIKSRKGKTVPLDILLDAANLAVYYSKARNAGRTDLYYTPVKYLRRAKNGPKGLVIPTNEKNLCITPDRKRLERLDSIHEEAGL